eukprot:TRINITY_DN52812_c0_g1_i1.p2 TRINITY_DN52812_c0_g1~~TRINITY_DN52812_c0_g1_i1.p2  ORF type:complete len:257 (+),score=68.01 TRINITY_DN52812_c0_g1_i1:75-845(+)
MPVVVARHGERTDFVDPATWYGSKAGKVRPWDPPLTTRGREQAREMGRRLRLKLRDMRLPDVQAVYASPFIRTIQTAEEAIKGMGLDTTMRICPEDGLLELMSDEWIRSWGLPESTGEWGGPAAFRGKTVDEGVLHPDTLLGPGVWAHTPGHLHKHVSPLVDPNYPSISTIRREGLRWGVLENWGSHKDRVGDAVKQLEKRHPLGTILCVSHGAPVGAFYQYASKKKEHPSVGYVAHFIYSRDPKTRNWRVHDIVS